MIPKQTAEIRGKRHTKNGSQAKAYPCFANFIFRISARLPCIPGNEKVDVVSI